MDKIIKIELFLSQSDIFSLIIHISTCFVSLLLLATRAAVDMMTCAPAIRAIGAIGARTGGEGGGDILAHTHCS